MDGTANNRYVTFKQTSRFDGKNPDDFFEWSSKLRASLSIYNKAIFDILQGQNQSSETNDSQATGLAA